jgi:hypothetical protein
MRDMEEKTALVVEDHSGSFGARPHGTPDFIGLRRV